MKLIYKILGCILLLAILFIFLFSLYKGDIEKSNLTDWISAFCNLVMASAALGGYLIAKDWKRHAVKDKVLNLALEMKTTYAPQMYEGASEINITLHKLKKLSENHVQPKNGNSEFNKYLESLVRDFSDSNTKFRESVYSFNRNHAQIQSLGYDFKHDLPYSLDTIEFNVLTAHSFGNVFSLHLNNLIPKPLSHSFSFEQRAASGGSLFNELITSEVAKEMEKYVVQSIELLHEYHITPKGSVFNDLKYIG